MAFAQVQVKFIPNNQDTQNLSFNGYLYRMKINNGERIYWRCTVKDCPATINTRNNIPDGFGRRPHNPPRNQAKIDAKQIINTIRNRAKSEAEPLPKLYDEEICKLKTQNWNDDTKNTVEQLPTFPSVKSSLYRVRRKVTPKLPTTQQNIILERQWTQTTTGEECLLFDDGDNNHIITFATSQNLIDLANAETLYCEGTFYTCPSQFQQKYTIYARIYDQMYPLLFALLPRKTQAVYSKLLTKLKTSMADLQFQLASTTIFMDFETAAQNAARTVFPGTSIKGCFFNYTQAIWRKTQHTGLQITYRNNQDIRQLVRRAAVLPLVPIDLIEDVWFNALSDLEDIDTPANTTTFTDYVTTQWIDGDRQVWNHFNADGPRTTNYIEGWHNKLKKKVSHAHPNIYTLISTFKDIQAANEVTRIQRNAGGIRPKAKRYRHRQQTNPTQGTPYQWTH